MARKSQSSAAETLEEIESGAERLAEWIQEHLAIVVGFVVVALVGAGGFSWYLGARDSAETEASSALGAARNDYLAAMGAPPGAIDVPELANPEAAERIRSEYRERFQSIADEHAGTVAGALARMEVGNLLSEVGEWEASLEAWEQALAEAPPTPGLRGLLLGRIAQTHEELGSWERAAESHEEAAGLEEYPLRYWAMADAARCWARAGQRERALALYERVESEAPDMKLPDHMRVQIRELRAASVMLP